MIINHVRRRVTAVIAETVIETAEVQNVTQHSPLKFNSIYFFIFLANNDLSLMAEYSPNGRHLEK
jgi:hypothetical protein